LGSGSWNVSGTTNLRADDDIKAMNFKKRSIIPGFVLLLALAVIPGYFRVYTILGNSDAPDLSSGSRVLVSFISYDIGLPYNRDDSKDSRHFGFVSRERIIGKVIVK